MLQALSSANIITLLNGNLLLLVVCLQLGARAVHAHQCKCDVAVVEFCHQFLSCIRLTGRISSHASLNNNITRVATSAKIPALLKPTGVCRSDSKSPDDMSVGAWKLGRQFSWDSTCMDSVASPPQRPRIAK